ncbi:MAG: stage V sporulation protein AD, partial [Clostridia bacterium]
MRVINFKNVYLSDAATVVGKTEKDGPLAQYFDLCEEDCYFGQKTWESAESEMCRSALNILLAKTKMRDTDIELILGGDLLNQCTATGFAASTVPIPYLGLYGACSTIVEGILIASVFVDSGSTKNAIAMASSHFCSSERQFRFPLEYGAQRTPTAQNTVTGAGAYLLQTEKSPFKIKNACVGKVNINGITDSN